MAGKTKGEVKSDKPIFKMSSNENPLGISPLAVQAIHDNLSKVSEYPNRTGKPLQVALAKYYDNQIAPEQFITGNGGIGVIELIIHAFLGEGRECIVCNPTFKPYIRFSEKVGTIIKDVPLVGDDHSLNIEGILEVVTDDTRVVWLCSPSNPMGTYIKKQQLETLIDALPDHVVLVYDEVYFHFVEAEDFSLGLPYVLKGKNVIAVNSFSKAYGLAGIRVGYAYSTPELAAYVNKVRRPFLINTLSLEACIAALSDSDFIEQTKSVVREGKAYLYKELDQIGVKYWKSQTNFITLKPDMDEKLCEQKMLEEGIMVRPVGNFGAHGCIRVTIGKREANEAFIEALKKVIR